MGSRLEQGYRYLMKAKKLAPRDPRLKSGFELFERERPPVVEDLAPEHLVNVILGQARSFGRSAFHKAMLAVLLLESVFLTGSLLT